METIHIEKIDIEEPSKKNAMEIENSAKEEILSPNVKIQMELLEKQNNDLIKEKSNLKKEIENLNLFKVLIKNIKTRKFIIKKTSNQFFFLFKCQNNYEETFFKSKTFVDLVQQSQELLKYTNNMKAKLIAANKKILEIERLRNEELEEIFIKFKEEKEKLLEQVKVNSNNSNEKKDDISNYFDISQFTKPLIISLEEANKNNETLKQEVVLF